MYRWGIGKLSKGRDQNILLITLGLSIILENAALFFFTGDQQTVNLSYSYDALDLGFCIPVLPENHFILCVSANLCIALGFDEPN